MIFNSLYGMGEWPGPMKKTLRGAGAKGEMAGIEQTTMPYALNRLEPAGSHREGWQKAGLESVQKGGTKEGTEMLPTQAARLKEICVSKVGLETITDCTCAQSGTAGDHTLVMSLNHSENNR